MTTATAARPVRRSPRPPTLDHRVGDALVVALGALALRVPAFVSPMQLGFDDGQFASSVLAMRAGGIPFREVFSSQGPLFLPLVWLGDLLTLRTIDSPRAIAVLSGAALAAAVYLAGREITGRAGALVAAALVATSGSVLWTTGPLTADGPGGALATACVAGALAYRRAPSSRQAVGVGALAGCAFSVKSLLVVPTLVAAAVVVLAGRRSRDAAGAALAAGAVTVLTVVPFGVNAVLDQSVRYHTDQAGHLAVLDNLRKTTTTLVDRDLPLLAAAGAALVGGVTGGVVGARGARRGASGRDPGAPGRLGVLGTGRAPIVVWLALVIALVLLEAPMWRNHLTHVVVPAALLVGSARLRWRWLALPALLALPWSVAHVDVLLWPHHYSEPAASAIRELRGLPREAQVVSDDPGLVWRAGKRPPDRFVDVSILRITSPRPSLRIDEDDVVAAARSRVVCAVVRWSAARFGSFSSLERRLDALGYRDGLRRGVQTVWIKPGCAPGGRTSAAAAPSRSGG